MMFAQMVLTDTTLKAIQNDQFFISHKHYVEDGLPNLEEQQGKMQVFEDDRSISSVVRTPPFVSAQSAPQTSLFSTEVFAPVSH